MNNAGTHFIQGMSGSKGNLIYAPLARSSQGHMETSGVTVQPDRKNYKI